MVEPGKQPGPLQNDRSRECFVLVIDDDEMVRDTLADFLVDEGYRVLVAGGGDEALRLLASSAPRPSLIILDLKMPNLDGWGFRARQAQDPALASIPVIVVTAAPNAIADAAAVLRKPLRLAHLASAMQAILAGPPESERS